MEVPETKPMSVKKKKTYRVVESRYMQAATHGSGGARRQTPTRNNVTCNLLHKNDEKMEETLASTSGVKISTPRKNMKGSPYLNCGEISSINSTKNQSVLAFDVSKNPVIKKPLLSNNTITSLRKLKGNNLGQKDLFGPRASVTVAKKENIPIGDGGKQQNAIWDPNNPMDVEILYSQYLISNYLAEHAEKSLEIQEKDCHRLLFSLVESNKALADKNYQLKEKVQSCQMEKDCRELLQNQVESLKPIEQVITMFHNMASDIGQCLETFQNQLLLKNIEVEKDDELEQELKSISDEMSKVSIIKASTDPLLTPLCELYRDMAEHKIKDGNENRVLMKCQDLLATSALQVSMVLQGAKSISNPIGSEIDTQIDHLLYSW